jgi:hypothetical protein
LEEDLVLDDERFWEAARLSVSGQYTGAQRRSGIVLHLTANPNLSDPLLSSIFLHMNIKLTA